MAHVPRPCFRAARNLWYVELGKRQVPIGKHPAHLPPPRKAKSAWDPPRDILDAYHRVMAAHADDAPAPHRASDPARPVTTAEVLDEFLDWLRQQPHKAPRTVAWYEGYLQSFLDGLEDQLLPVLELQPAHVTRWLSLHPGWTTGRRGAITAVQRALNWSAREGLLKSLGVRSLFAGMEKPPQGRREQLVSRAEFEELLACVRDDAFRDVLTAAWHTGCRPQELFTVSAPFYDAAQKQWVFPLKESKGKRVRRVVYLSDEMVTLTERLAW